MLSICDNGTGYGIVNLKLDGAQQMRTVHRLVMLAFMGLCPRGLEVCHGDGVRHNNKLSNLRYDTRKGNLQDKHQHGTAICGEKHQWSRLTSDQVRSIRQLVKQGKTQRAIAKQFHVHFATISAIICGKSWGHLK
jgi:hypothetical protein